MKTKLTPVASLHIESWYRITWKRANGHNGSALFPGDMVRSAEATLIGAGLAIVSTDLHEVPGFDRSANEEMAA